MAADRGSRDLPTRWDLEADIVVVGYGLSGAVAAIECHDAGASVIVLEKMPQEGGISRTAGGFTSVTRSAAEAFLRWHAEGRSS